MFQTNNINPESYRIYKVPIKSPHSLGLLLKVLAPFQSAGLGERNRSGITKSSPSRRAILQPERLQSCEPPEAAGRGGRTGRHPAWLSSGPEPTQPSGSIGAAAARLHQPSCRAQWSSWFALIALAARTPETKGGGG